MAIEYTPSLTDLTHPVQGDDSSLSQEEILLVKQYINNTVMPALIAGIQPPSASGFVYEGNYSSVTAYFTNNIVTFGGALYIAIAATTGNAPSNTSYWALVVPANSVLTTEGDLLYYNSGANARLPLGANGYHLVSNGTDPIWVVNDTPESFTAQNVGLIPLVDSANSNTAVAVSLPSKISALPNPACGPVKRPIARGFSTTYHVWINKHGEIVFRGSSGTFKYGGNNAGGSLQGAVILNNFSAAYGLPAANEIFVQVFSAGDTILGLSNLGNVWAIGNNSTGCCGDNTTTEKYLWQKVYALGPNALWNGVSSPIVTLCVGRAAGNAAAGGNNCTIYAIDTYGRLFGWGYNAYGQLGDGTTSQQNLPELIYGSWGTNAIVSISSSGFHTLVLDVTGVVHSCGKNGQGELGIGSISNQATFTAITGSGKVVTASVRQIMALADNSGAYGSSALITTGGAFYGTGYNADGRIGNNSTSNVTSLTASSGSVTFNSIYASAEGQYCTMYGIVGSAGNVTPPASNGGLYVWGTNIKGQCCQGNTTNVLVPTRPSNTPLANSVLASVGANNGTVTSTSVVFDPTKVTSVFPILGTTIAAANNAALCYDGTYYWFFGYSGLWNYYSNSAAANIINAVPAAMPLCIANGSDFIIDFCSLKDNASGSSFVIENNSGRQYGIGYNATNMINDSGLNTGQFIEITY